MKNIINKLVLVLFICGSIGGMTGTYFLGFQAGYDQSWSDRGSNSVVPMALYQKDTKELKDEVARLQSLNK